jgi:hypothetical protein
MHHSFLSTAVTMKEEDNKEKIMLSVEHIMRSYRGKQIKMTTIIVHFSIIHLFEEEIASGNGCIIDIIWSQRGLNISGTSCKII